MTEVNIGDKYAYEGIIFEIVSLSSGAHGGLVWVAWPNVNKLNSSVETYLRDEFEQLIKGGTLVVAK